MFLALPLIYREKKRFPAILWQNYQSKFNLKKHTPLIHYTLYILWQLVQYEPKPLEAYYTESYWSEALLCTFCETGKCEEKPEKAYSTVPYRRDENQVFD